MAILKDLIVQGVSKFLGTVYGEKFVKSGGTSSLFLKADGSTDSNTYVNTTSVDASPTNGSTNPVQSGGVYTALSEKQATLVSGTNIKSINSSSLLGSGNINLVSDVKQDNVSVVTNNVANIPHDVLQLDNWDFDSDMLGGSVTDALYATIVLAADSHKLIKVGNTLLTVYEDTDDYIVCGVTPNDMSGEIAVKSLAISKQSYSGEHYIEDLKLISETTINELILNALSNYVPTSRKINNKLLSSDVTLKAGDIDLTTNITVDGTSKTTTLAALEAINTLAASKQDGPLTVTGSNSVLKSNLESIILAYPNKDCYISLYGHSYKVLAREYDHDYRHLVAGSMNTTTGNFRLIYFTWAYEDSDSTQVTYTYKDIYYKTDIDTLLTSKQDSLVSGINIKTVNGTSLLGGGDIAVVSVDAGNINVLQSTGNSQVDVMSQKAISDEFTITRFDAKRPSYFTGRLARVNFNDFPLLNPKNCEGISVMWSCTGTSGYINYIYDLFPSTINSNANNLAIAYRNSIKVGLMTGYAATIIQGTSPNTGYRKHNVVTFNFKTGETKVYGNGVLIYSQVPTNYDASVVADYLTTVQQCTLNTLSVAKGTLKHLGIAVFGHVLEDNEVAEIYGGGDESIRSTLVPTIYEANQLSPFISTSWDVSLNYGTKTAVDGGGYILTGGDTTGSLILFGFTGISGVKNNCIYEWDFEIITGSMPMSIGSTNHSRKMQYSQTVNSVFTITDSNGNDVTRSDLAQGQIYHVTCKPDNIRAQAINAGSLLLQYYLYGTEGFQIKIYPTLRVQERGAALICDNNTYKGLYWEQSNGYKIPTDDFSLHESQAMKVYYDIYMPNIKQYTTNAVVEFNGQMAVDAVNGKIYIGYLTGTGGTWKQINNS